MRTGGPAARRWSVVATALGTVLLIGGLLAGLVNRNVLDGPRFAQHVDAVRRDPAVARQVGLAITGRVLAAQPDLVAVRPLVESVATSLVASPAFSPVVRFAARQLHEAFTAENPGQVLLRLADVGAVLSGVLPAIAPQATRHLPADLNVTLARAGAQSYAAATIHLARLCALLGWLLPLLAVLTFAAGLLLSPDRARATVRTGWAVAAAGAAVGLVALIGTVTASVADENTLRGALVAAGWREFGGALWWVAGLTVGAGIVLVAAASARIPTVDLGQQFRRTWSWIAHPPRGRWARVGHGTVLVVVGIGAVLRPRLVFGVLAALVGLLLVVAGVGEIAAAAGARRASTRPGRTRRRWGPAVALGTAVAVLVALVVVDGVPADQRVRTAAAADGTACNGHVELCGRRYNDVAFPATHNAMSAADEPGWFIPEQPTGLVGQLDAGIRVLLIDSWYGQPTQRPGVIATSAGSYAAALAQAKEEFGSTVVTSALRVRNAVTSKPTGPVRPYLCHGLCEIGATAWEPVMAQARAWIVAHPREVVTFFIQDEVSPADTAAVFDEAGLLPYLHTQRPGRPWPTLGEMIDSGRRVVVLMEKHGGGKKYPWMLQGFDWVQDTPFTNPTAADLTCSLNRGTRTHPLFLVNYWLSNFQSLVTDSRKINAFDKLWPYLAKCRRQRGQIPNYIAVNFFNEGNLFRAVDRLNGVR